MAGLSRWFPIGLDPGSRAERPSPVFCSKAFLISLFELLPFLPSQIFLPGISATFFPSSDVLFFLHGRLFSLLLKVWTRRPAFFSPPCSFAIDKLEPRALPILSWFFFPHVHSEPRFPLFGFREIIDQAWMFSRHFVCSEPDASQRKRRNRHFLDPRLPSCTHLLILRWIFVFAVSLR